MKLIRSKEWWIAKANLESGKMVGAGKFAVEPIPVFPSVPSLSNSVDDGRIAFSRFVSGMRRKAGWTVEAMANRAELDVKELLLIEEDLRHIPEPRTVYMLAELFRVSQQKLMQLAGLAVANDSHFSVEATKFAARSESVQKLSLEEQAALEAFVAILGERELK